MNNHRQTVLACIDGSSHSEAVVDYAAWAARTVNNALKLLHNIEHQSVPDANLSGNIGLGSREALQEKLTEIEAERSKLQLEQGRMMLEGAQQRAESQGTENISTLQQHGSLTESLISMEEEIRVLVLGVRGEGHENQTKQIGAQLESVIRAMHRPVLIVNRPFTEAPKRILLAYDGKESSRKALDMVATSPLYKGMECHLVHVSKEKQSDTSLLTEAESALSDAELTVVTAELNGDVEQVLLQYQKDNQIDMTVMGAFGQNRLKELLFGSVTARMLSQSEIPLLLLR